MNVESAKEGKRITIIGCDYPKDSDEFKYWLSFDRSSVV